MRKEKLKEETKEGLCIGMVLSLFHKQVRSKGFITKVKFSTINLDLLYSTGIRVGELVKLPFREE